MYDEVMQLIALAKNDEQYFKRIDDLKQQMLELAQVKEIAKTLGEADMHYASAKQKASQIIVDAEKEAEVIKNTSKAFVEETKATLQKARDKKASAEKKEIEYNDLLNKMQSKIVEMDKSISEHRTLTALRNEEVEKAQKTRNDFERKLRAIKEIAVSE